MFYASDNVALLVKLLYEYNINQYSGNQIRLKMAYQLYNNCFKKDAPFKFQFQSNKLHKKWKILESTQKRHIITDECIKKLIHQTKMCTYNIIESKYWKSFIVHTN